MIENRDLMATILRYPEDDAPRLVYADWLEENGDEARAEFIRVQIELAMASIGCERCKMQQTARDLGVGVPVCPKHDALRARERELLNKHICAWSDFMPEELITKQCQSCLDGLPDWETNVVECRRCDGMGIVEDYDRIDFRRGLIEVIQCTAEQWEQHHAAISAECPITEVRHTTPFELVIRAGDDEKIQILSEDGTYRRVFADLPTHQPVEYSVEKLMLADRWPGIKFVRLYTA